MKRIIGLIWLVLLAAIPACATVSTETTRVAYTCNGVLTSYAYPFKVLADGDLLVVKKATATATSAETTLVLNTDYTVTGAGTSGGNVVLTAGSKCGSGYTLTILRNMAATQTTDYVDGEAFSAESLETALDKATLVLQQQKEQIGRAPKLPKTSTITDIALPNPTASNYIGWNAAATGLENKSGPVITTATQYEVDALISYGGGTSYTQATIEAALTAIGTSNKVTLLLRPGTWVISSNADWSAYTNVTFKIVPGAVISHSTYTVDIPNVDAGLYKVFDGAGLLSFYGSIDKIFPQWYGAVGDGSADDTLPIQYALNSVAQYNKKKLHLHIPSGLYKLTDTLTLRNLVSGQTRGGYTISGSGYQSVLYQTGAGKTALEIGERAAGDTVPHEGVTIKDLSVVGTTGTLYGLHLNNVVRSYFSNLYLMADEADLTLEGAILNVWSGIKLSYAPFNENPITGITIPTTRNYGLFTISHPQSFTTNAFSGLVCEGHATGGLYIEGGSTNTWTNVAVEGELGYGVLSSAEWDSWTGFYSESNAGVDFTLLNAQKNTLSNFFVTSGSVVFANASWNTISSSRCSGGAGWTLGAASQHNTFISSDGILNYAADSTAGQYTRFLNCNLSDVTHNIDIRNGYSAGTTAAFSTVAPRVFQEEINYGVGVPSGRRWGLGDKVLFSVGNAAGNLGPLAGGYLGAIVTFRLATTLNGGEPSGETAMVVASGTGTVNGDIIGITQDDGTIHWSTIASGGGTTTLTMAAGLTDDAATGLDVYVLRWALWGETGGIATLANDATPSVQGGSKYLTGGTTTITDFDDGLVGQVIMVIAEHSITITDGTNIFLNGSANYVMAATDTLTLIQKADGNWYEIGRSDN